MEHIRHSSFEQAVVPPWGAACTFVWWLAGNVGEAREASLRAFKSSSSFRGGDARPWLLTIVRLYARFLPQRDWRRP